MKKYSVWQWRNTQGVSLHNPAAEAHVTWRQTGRHWGGSLGRDVPGHRVLWQWYFLTIEEVIHLWTLITVQMEIFAKNRSVDEVFARLLSISNRWLNQLMGFAFVFSKWATKLTQKVGHIVDLSLKEDEAASSYADQWEVRSACSTNAGSGGLSFG